MELLMTFSLMALLTSMAVPMLSPILDGMRLKEDAQEMAAVLRMTRQKAISTGNTITVYFYPYGDYYRVQGGDTYQLREGISFGGSSFGQAYPDGPPACGFSPSGAPQPRAGTAVLSDAGGNKLYVIVNPVVGRVRVSETPPDSWAD